MMDPSKMTVAQLKEELDARGLSTTGKKEELKERLIEATTTTTNEDDDEEEEEDMGPHYKEWDDKRAEVCARIYPSALSCAAKTDPTRKTRAPQPLRGGQDKGHPGHRRAHEGFRTRDEVCPGSTTQGRYPRFG